MARLWMNRAPHAAESEIGDVIRVQDGMILACTPQTKIPFENIIAQVISLLNFYFITP